MSTNLTPIQRGMRSRAIICSHAMLALHAESTGNLGILKDCAVKVNGEYILLDEYCLSLGENDVSEKEFEALTAYLNLCEFIADFVVGLARIRGLDPEF